MWAWIWLLVEGSVVHGIRLVSIRVLVVCRAVRLYKAIVICLLVLLLVEIRCMGHLNVIIRSSTTLLRPRILLGHDLPRRLSMAVHDGGIERVESDGIGLE